MRAEDARFRLGFGYRDTLAACLAATGDFAAAVREQQAVLDEARAQDAPSIATFERRLAQYRARKAWRDTVD